jgi:hypothetical protein
MAKNGHTMIFSIYRKLVTLRVYGRGQRHTVTRDFVYRTRSHNAPGGCYYTPISRSSQHQNNPLRLQLTPLRSSDKAAHRAFESAATVQHWGRRFFRFSDFILVPLSDVIASASQSRFDRFFPVILHWTAEKPVAPPREHGTGHSGGCKRACFAIYVQVHMRSCFEGKTQYWRKNAICLANNFSARSTQVRKTAGCKCRRGGGSSPATMPR